MGDGERYRFWPVKRLKTVLESAEMNERKKFMGMVDIPLKCYIYTRWTVLSGESSGNFMSKSGLILWSGRNT